MIARDHDCADSGRPAELHRREDLRSDRVNHARKSYENELLLEVLRLVLLRTRVPEALRRREHAERPVRIRLILCKDLPPLLICERMNPVFIQIGDAPPDHFVGRALRELDKPRRTLPGRLDFCK